MQLCGDGDNGRAKSALQALCCAFILRVKRWVTYDIESLRGDMPLLSHSGSS